MRLVTSNRVGFLVATVAGIAIGTLALGSAHADAGRPSAAAVRHYTIDSSAFTPDGLHDATSDYFNEWDPATLGNQNSGRCFDTGVVLPNGATLESVAFYYTAGASNVMYMELNRQDLGAHTALELADFDSTPTGTTPTYTKTVLPITSGTKVNTSKYAYSVGVCPYGDSSFTAVTITYTG